MGQGSAASRQSWSATGGFILLFLLILAVEVVLDVVLFPADPVLIPAELIGDALLLSAAGSGAFLASRGAGSSGSQRGGRKTTRSMRGSRRGVTGAGIGIVLGAWLFLAGVLLFEWWFAVNHVILTVLFLPFELVFDGTVFIVVVVVTVIGLTSPGRSAATGRQVGGR